MQLSVAQPARAQQAHERGQESMLQFQALRSGGFYMETVNAMMTRLTSSQIVAKLGLKPSTPEPLPPGDQLASADVKLAKLHWDFLMDLAANRCWSQSFHTILPPCLREHALLLDQSYLTSRTSGRTFSGMPRCRAAG